MQPDLKPPMLEMIFSAVSAGYSSRYQK